MFFDEDLSDYFGTRSVAVEEKINECVDAARRGETSVEIDTGDLTESEIARLEREVRRRIGNK